jgi:hypothetical protein
MAQILHFDMIKYRINLVPRRAWERGWYRMRLPNYILGLDYYCDITSLIVLILMRLALWETRQRTRRKLTT